MKLRKISILLLTAAMCTGSVIGGSVVCFAETASETTVSQNEITMEGQALGLSGVENARQLGGYVTEDGRKVKSGMLLRSAKLAEATEDDIQKLTDEYNLGTVVDFRTTDEIKSAPDPEIEGVENKQIRILNEDDSSDNSNTTMTGMYASDPVGAMIEMVKNNMVGDDMYVSVVNDEFSQKGYAEFFQTLLNNTDGKAVLWHCTGGKDRAGTAAVLVLSALGVDEETILNDFELTNEFYKDKIAYMAAEAAKKTDDEAIIEGVKSLTGVSREYMEKMITSLDEEYGSVKNYIVEKLGVSEDDIETLKTMYLE